MQQGATPSLHGASGLKAESDGEQEDETMQLVTGAFGGYTSSREGDGSFWVEVGLCRDAAMKGGNM